MEEKKLIYKNKAAEILKGMTLKEKIGQLNQISFSDLETVKERIRQGEVGSVIFAPKENLEELQRIAVEESRTGIPLIIGRDVIHGHHTVFPVPLAQSAAFNPNLTEKAYECTAKEAANDGIHWTYAPMIDISRDPRWGRCVEGIGEDPYLGEKMAEAVVKGLQGEDYGKPESLAACAKHYIGYAAVEGGRDYGKAEISDYTMRNYYLKPFKAAVNAGAATVMNSFNSLSGMSTASNKYLLTDLLKEELGFGGYVISDWAAIVHIITQGLAKNEYEASMLAINAGLDMDMASGCYAENLEQLVQDGKVSEKTIDESVLRVLYIKLLFGIFDNPYSGGQIEYSEEEHRKVAKQCSDESMVLLKNKNNILPLKKEQKIFVLGPMLYEKRSLLGTWTLDGDINAVKSVADVIKEKKINAVFPESEYLWDDCLKMIRMRECEAVVVMLGESYNSTGEARTVARTELPEEQLALVKRLYAIGKPVIGVMAFGRPIALEEAEECFDAILYSWHSGTCTSESIVSVLYGEVNPSGRLPMTFPRCTGQIPIYYNYPNGVNYGEYYYRDKEHAVYDDRIAEPMYPFGFGLSYTEFEYSDIYCENDKISYNDIAKGEKFRIYATVNNIGKTDGAEVSQCYIHDICAESIRPQRELKGFSKNFIKAGESKKVCFELGFDELAFYNSKTEFKPEPGEFDIYVGKDCYADKALTIEIL